jgi:hypothetical protein
LVTIKSSMHQRQNLTMIGRWSGDQTAALTGGECGLANEREHSRRLKYYPPYIYIITLL